MATRLNRASTGQPPTADARRWGLTPGQTRGAAVLLTAAVLLVGWRWSQTPSIVGDPQRSEGEHAPHLEHRIDPNRATAAQLAAMPGLGPARAADILADREAGTPYTSADDLQRIKGIGPAMVNKLRPHLVFPTDTE
ncbi:MAG: ComEA family DNA-binding protein [Planctomycetota bacterium]